MYDDQRCSTETVYRKLRCVQRAYRHSTLTLNWPSKLGSVDEHGRDKTNDCLCAADQVTEEDLRSVFSRAGEVHSVKRCRDTNNKRPLSYGYVNYVKPEGAEIAIRTLNHVEICGKSVRVMPSQRDGAARTSGIGNIFVKNLHPDNVTNQVLHNHFQRFGVVTSAKVARDERGVSKKYGFVQFRDPDCANQAIKDLDGSELCGQILEVAQFIPAKDRASEPGKYCNIYVKGLGSTVSDEVLRNAFEKFGPITSTVIMKNEKGFSRGFGFVNFEKADHAARAVEEMDGYSLDGQRWKVHRAQKRSEAVAKDSQQLYHYRRNLIVKNLHPSCTEEELRGWLEEFGNVELVRMGSGEEKGVAYVCFQTSEDAEAAIVGLNGQTVGNQVQQLQVVLAPRQRHLEPRRQPPQPVQRAAVGGTAERSSPVPYVQPHPVPSIITPTFPYYAPQGTAYFYGHPAYPVQSGQQQLSTGFLPLTPQMFDSMGGLLGVPNAPPFQGMAAVPGLVRIDNSQASPYGYEGHATGQQQPWGEQDFQGRSRIDRGRQGYTWQAQPMGLPERLPQRQRPPPFPSRASQQARGMEFARQSQFSQAARPETSQVLAPRHPDSSREQQSLASEQYRRRLDVTHPMIGPQATESLITTEGVTSISLLQTDLHPQGTGAERDYPERGP